MLRIGDEVIANNVCTMMEGEDELEDSDCLTIGKYYKVIEIKRSENKFVIIDDDNDEHTFGIGDGTYFDFS